MKLRKTIKKIVALGTGITMLGATVFGATAADLSDYPNMFINNGVFDGSIVVGDAAAASDTIGAVDIATAMQVESVSDVAVADGDGVTVVVEGDAYQIRESNDMLTLREELDNVISSVTDDELDSLEEGTLSNQQGTFDYSQEITIPESATVDFIVEDDIDEDPQLYLKFADNQVVYEYSVTFTPAVESDVAPTGASNEDEVEDLENKKIKLLGKEFTILDTSYDDTGAGQMEISLMSGAIQDTLEEYTSKTYTLNGVDYEVEVIAVSSEPDCILKVNGEVTDKLEEGETYTLNDGIEVGIKTLLENEGSEVGGGDIVEFYLGADSVTLTDTAFTTAGKNQIEIQSEDLNDAYFDFSGSEPSADKVKIDEIKIWWNATDDYFVPMGKALSEQLDGEEKDFLFLENIDFQFAGITFDDVEEVEIKGNNDLVGLTAPLQDGTFNEDIFYMSTTGGTAGDVTIAYGDDADEIYQLNPGTALDEGHRAIISNAATEETYVIEVISFDSNDETVTFKNIVTGDQWEETTIANAGDIRLGGVNYAFTANYVAETVDFTSFGATTSNNAVIYTENGLMMTLSVNGSDIGFVTVKEEEDRDEVDVTNAIFNVTVGPNSDDSEVRLNVVENAIIDLTGLDSDDDKSVGYTDWGSKVTEDKITDEGAVMIEYPDNEAEVQVYISSGVTSSSTVGGSSDGTAQKVNPIAVGSAKLASEINMNNLGAQNLIVVGGPCANPVAAKLMGNPADCTEGFVEGEAIIKLYEQGSKVSMLVAGATALDTRRAARVLADYSDYASLTGSEVVVKGTSTTFSDTVVSAPSAAPADDMEDDMEDDTEGDME